MSPGSVKKINEKSKFKFRKTKGDGGSWDATCFAVKQKILSENRGEG